MASGRVSNEVLDILRRAVEDRGIVVWFDPQKAYAALAERLELPETELLKYEGGFFRLREQLETFLEFVHEDGSMRPAADVPPRVVVYVPIGREECGFALIEAETAGVVVEPKAVTPERDSHIGRVVQRVYQAIAPTKAEHLARQAEDGLLTLEELDRMADEAATPAAGALQVIFGAASVEEILLQFVSNDKHDEVVEAKSVLAEIVALGESELGWRPDDPGSLLGCRKGLRRYLLACDLALAIPADKRPEAFSAIAVPGALGQQDLIRHLCGIWRNRVDLQGAYVEAANSVQREAGLASFEPELDGLKGCETFPVIDRWWRDWAAARTIGGDPESSLEVARKRSEGFWARVDPALQLGWKVLESAAELVMAASEVEVQATRGKWSVEELVDAYTSHAHPWMRLDRLAREMESRHAHWEVADESSDGLEQLVAYCRNRYSRASAALAELYVGALLDADLGLGRAPRHCDVFSSFVRPELEKDHKTAFFMVDALRYEMAAELVEGLEREFDVQLQPTLGTLPGLTPLGMAALLPNARNGLALEQGARGPDVQIDGHSVTDRKSRLDALAASYGAPTCVATLGEILKPAFRRRKEFAEARLVVVTSQEIDLLGEEGDEEGIRLYMQDVLEKLRRALRVLAKADVERFVVATDHGFQYQPALEPGLKMDPPGGSTADLHPRVWIGEGGAAGDGFLRVGAPQLGLGGPYELAFPRGLGTFRVRGKTSPYMHGGISPAEHVLPIIRLSVRKTVSVVGESKVRLAMAKPEVTNRIFSVSAELIGEGLFPGAERRLRLEVLSAQKEVGQAVTAAYGFEDSTREVLVTGERPNVVTLMLAAGPAPTTITIRALDCETQVVLDSLKNMPVNLSI